VKLHKLLTENSIITDLKGRTRDEVLAEMAARVEEGHGELKAGELMKKLAEREAMGPTAIGNGVAIPHCKLQGLEVPLVLLGISRQGVQKWAPDSKPVHVVFLAVSSQEDPSVNLKLLALTAQLVRRSKDLSSKFLKAKTPGRIIDIIRELEEHGSE
jgi:PTS system nitrogen regulatory IIA component